MRFDDFINAVDRTSPVSVNEQVSAMLKLMPEDVAARFGTIAQSMPDDIRAAYFNHFIAKRQPSNEVRSKAGRKASSEKRVHVTITLPESLVDRLPYPRSSFIERAILAALES